MKENVPFEEIIKFDKYKAKAEGVFGRSLSDKEVAEAALDQLSAYTHENEKLKDYTCDLKADIDNLRQELSEQVHYDGVVKLVANKLQEIVSTKAKAYTIKIILNNTRVPTINYFVEGEPLMMEEEEYE